MTFEKWWKMLKPAECDEVKPQFEECWQKAYQAGLKDTEKLKQFALKILDNFPELGTFDGGDIQDIAVECGLLIGKEVNEPCGEGCNCAEYAFLDSEGKFADPVTCYRLAEVLK